MEYELDESDEKNETLFTLYLLDPLHIFNSFHFCDYANSQPFYILIGPSRLIFKLRILMDLKERVL